MENIEFGSMSSLVLVPLLIFLVSVFGFFAMLKFTKVGQRAMNSNAERGKRAAWAARRGYGYQEAPERNAFTLSGEIAGAGFTLRCWQEEERDSSGDQRSETFVELRCPYAAGKHAVDWSLDTRVGALLDGLGKVLNRVFDKQDVADGMRAVRLPDTAEQKLRLTAHDVASAQRVWTPKASSLALKIVQADCWLDAQGGTEGLQIKIRQSYPPTTMLENMIQLAELLLRTN